MWPLQGPTAIVAVVEISRRLMDVGCQELRTSDQGNKLTTKGVVSLGLPRHVISTPTSFKLLFPLTTNYLMGVSFLLCSQLVIPHVFNTRLCFTPALYKSRPYADLQDDNGYYWGKPWATPWGQTHLLIYLPVSLLPVPFLCWRFRDELESDRTYTSTLWREVSHWSGLGGQDVQDDRVRRHSSLQEGSYIA